jgi:hypothetical protein
LNYIDQLAQRIREEVPPDALPEGDTTSLFRLYALLGLAKGQAVTAKDVHDAWAVWMTGRDPDHSSIEPFQELSPSTRSEDAPFLAAIKRAVS